MKSLKCYMKRTILIEFLYIPHKYNGMCYVRLALLFLLLKRNPGHINNGAKINFKLTFPLSICTGKSLSEDLIFASINPQYDNRLFMELP